MGINTKGSAKKNIQTKEADPKEKLERDLKRKRLLFSMHEKTTGGITFAVHNKIVSFPKRKNVTT